VTFDLTGRALYPLADILDQQEFPLAEYVPSDALDTIFEGLYYTDAEAFTSAEGLHLNLRLAFEGELALSPPGLPGVSLVAASGGVGWTSLPVEFVIGPEPSAALREVPLTLRFERSLLKPMLSSTEVDEDSPGVDIDLGTISLEVGPEGFSAEVDLTASIPLCMIGDTGVLIEAVNVRPLLGLSPELPEGLDQDFRGVHIESAQVHLPQGLPELVPSDLLITDCSIGTGGFTGALALNYNPVFDAASGSFSGPGSGSLFGLAFGVRSVDIALVQNTFEAGAIAGSMLLPYFDEVLDVEIGLSLDGGFTVAVSSDDGLLTLRKEDLLELTVDSVGFGVDAGVFTVALSGTITPLVGDFDWPSFRVQSLSIDSQGNVRIQGGWLDLREQYVLDLSGFQFEIARIGFGTTESGQRWIGFSGGLKLVDGVTAGASVEGLRIAWDPATGDVSLTLDGVGVEFEVPGTVRFSGYVAMTQPAPGVTRFDGQISLSLISVGLEIEAQLVVGYDENVDSAFFAIYLGVELPAGIPLWSTGLGLFGLAGLFALNMEPNRTPEQAWYAIQPAPSWYHAAPSVGVADLRKWRNQDGSLALGGGVTIGTVADNGFTFAGRFLLGIILPGPILFIEGRANLLKERSSLSDEPVFRALVVLDARAGTFLVGLDAQYQFAGGGELIDISGGAEAFFDFTDPLAWHLYLGIDEPRERRIRAEIFFRIFEANAYFMLDAERLATGAWIGYDMQWRFGPLKVVLQAWIEGNAELSWKPVYFEGSLWLHGKIEASAFGFGFRLGADARVTAGVFDPFQILAELSVSVGLPWPLPDFDVTIELQWGPEPDPPPLPVPLKEVAVEHLKVSTTWPLPPANPALLAPHPDPDGDGFFAVPTPALSDTAPAPAQSPVVPLDARPRITFGRTVHDRALVGVNPSPVLPNSAPEAGWEWIGDPQANQGPARVRTSVTEVALERWDGTRWQAVARKAADANLAGVPGLYGSWAHVPQLPGGTPMAGSPPPTANTKLWLWSRSAFDYTRRTGGEWDEWFSRMYPDYPCIGVPADERYCCDFAGLPVGPAPAPPWVCPEHPDIVVGWRVPPGPQVVGAADGRDPEDRDGRMLCFPTGGEAAVALGRPVTRVQIEVQAEPGERRDCSDLRDRQEEQGPNPLREGRVRFTVHDHPGQPAAQTRLLRVETTEGRLSGLDAGVLTEIDLARPADFVEVLATHFAHPGRFTAFDENGKAVAGSQLSQAQRTPQTVRLERTLRQQPIVRVVVEAPADELVIHQVCLGGLRPGVTGVAIDRHRRTIGEFPAEQGVIDVPGRDVVAVRVHGDGAAFCLLQVCVTVSVDRAEVIWREEMLRHIQEQLAIWEADGEVLDPYTSYRLKVATTVEVADFPHDAAFNGTRTLTYGAHFRTQGPPGLARYDVPVGHPQAGVPPPAGPQDPPGFASGLDDLIPYVEQTVPPTVPAEGEKPALPRPVYRAYDVGVMFNETYVDQMYRAAGRDLVLYLYDNNNLPVRDHRGALLTMVNRWGRAEQVTLSASEERWVRQVDAASCTEVDVSVFARNLTLGVDGHVLDPETVYEGRLVPLLAHEAFAGYAVGARAGGTGATLQPAAGAVWTVRDEGSDQGPSDWVIREEGTPPARHVEQTSNVSAGAGQRDAAFPGGTLLIRGADPRLDAADADQPERWSDYRASVFVRSPDDDLIGVGVRWSGRRGYLFTLDRQLDRRRLVRVSGGVGTVLAEVAGGYEQHRDLLISVEVVGDRLRAFVDGELVVEVQDDRWAAGSVALYSGQNAGTRFADVSVDDLRGVAPTVYRFAFTTSDFTDFRHHLHSFPGFVFTAPVADVAPVAAAVAEARGVAEVVQPVSEAEARAFDALTVEALGTAARQTLRAVDVTRLEHDGAALGLLVRTGEPLDWGRLALAVERAPAQAFVPEPPSRAGPRLVGTTFAITDPASPNDESVTVMLGGRVDLDGWRIQHRVLASPDALAMADGTRLAVADLEEDVEEGAPEAGPGWQPGLADLDGFHLQEAAGGIGAPLWSAAGGILRQDGPYRVPDPPAAIPTPRQGAYAVQADGDWQDLRLRVRLRATAPGAAGMVFRYRDPETHYRFAIDSVRGVRELVRRSAGATTLLHAEAFAPGLGQAHEVGIDALGSRLQVRMDGQPVCEVFDGELIRGTAGVYTCDEPLARFDQIQVETLTRRLGPFEIHDHGEVAAASTWSISDRLLRQDADLLTPGAPASTAEDSGSACMLGDPDWSDYRIEAALAPPEPGVCGLVFRWQDAGNHYRLLFDGSAGERHLLRRQAGMTTLLWAETAPLTEAGVTVEIVGTRLRAWLDGAVLFDLHDDGPTRGQAGVLALDGAAAGWRGFEVRHASPAWEDWHTFAGVGWRAAGRRIHVLSGREVDAPEILPRAGEERLFQGAVGPAFAARLQESGADLRLLVPDGRSGHTRRVLPDAAYVPVAGARVVRSADGTAFVLLLPDAVAPGGSALAPGEYRLRFTYRRDNRTADPPSLVLSQNGDSTDETATLDIPWSTP
jgi:hypothetical protein